MSEQIGGHILFSSAYERWLDGWGYEGSLQNGRCINYLTGEEHLVNDGQTVKIINFPIPEKETE